MIEVSLKRQQGDFRLDVAFSASNGITALFGPSGSGKTSIVQMIAGLSRPDEGRIVVDGNVWNDTSTRTFMPSHRRRIGYIFQEGRLFPHLTARQNLRYGRFFAGGSGQLSEGEVVDLLGIEKLLDQRPHTLSGGEKQRVAIGRALLSSPRMLLMDEPLSALDRARRQEILPFIERIRDTIRIPCIYVSHALDEVARLADRVVLLDEGKVRAIGAPGEVLGGLSGEEVAPQSVLEVRLVEHEPHYGLSIAELGPEVLTLQPVDLPVGTAVRIRIASTDVMIALERSEHVSALNQLPGTIVGMRLEGRHMLVDIDCHGQHLLSRITLLSAERLALSPGTPVFALFKAVTVDSGSIYHASGVT